MASYFPRSSGSVPLPNSHLDFPFLCPKYPWPTLFVVYSLWLSKVSCKDTSSGFEGSQDPGCSSFFSPYFGPLALISCKQGCTTPYPPQFQLLFSYWPTVLSREYLFWGSLIFRFLRHSLLPLLLSTKMLIPWKSSSHQWLPPTWILGFVVLSCLPVLL